MSPVAATLATLTIFFAPGLVIVGLSGDESRLKLTLGEKLYVAVAGSLPVSGWVGLVLAELGIFSPGAVAVGAGGLAGLVALVARKRLSLRAGPVVASELVVGALLLTFALVVYFPPYEHILGGRDPGIYVNTGLHLVREGSLVYTDRVVESVPPENWPLFFRVDKELPPWSHLRFQGFLLESPESARVVPHGLHLYPAWIALSAGLYEMKAGLYATPFFAMMAVLGWFLALKRLFGAEVACWASVLLTVFQIEIWFARFPNSEILVQFLYATALLFFFFMEEHRSPLAGALAGLALGATLLARMENVLFLIPVAVFFGWKRIRRELGRPELAFLGAFGALALHAALHDRLIAWPYVSNILGRHYWRFIGENLALVAVLGVVAFVAVDRLALELPRRWLDVASSGRARLTAAVALFLLAVYAYFVRPVWHGARTAPHDAEAFLRMGWYLYPVGLALAVSGAMVLMVRAKKSQAFFLLVALTFSLFFFYKVRVWHDHYFAMRRFMPVILPSLLAAIAVFLAFLRERPLPLARWAPRLIAALLLVVYLGDGSRIWGHEEFPGSLDFVEELARHVGDDDVVIFPRREGLHLLELPLAKLEGKNVLEFYTLKPPVHLLEDLLREWRDDYRDVFFVTNYKISLSGLFTRHVADFWFATKKYEYAYTRPPRGAEPFHLRFSLSKAVDIADLARRVPALPRLDVGGSDELQVAWFHEKELEEDGTTYRWSQRTSSIFLPAVGRGTTSLRIRLAGPKEDEAPHHPVAIRLDGELLATLTPGKDYETYALEIPAELAGRPERSYAILTIATEPWRPSNWIPGATDVRDLGARVDWIEVR